MSNPFVRIAALYTVSRVLLVVVGVIALKSMGMVSHNYSRNLHLEENRSAVIEVCYRWDAVWYLDIAKNGYTAQQNHPQYRRWLNTKIPFSAGFFPLLPFLLRGLHLLLPSWEIAGILMGFLVGLGVCLLLYDELRARLKESSAQRIVCLFIFFPASLFVSLPFAEGLLMLGFLFLVRGFRLKQWEWLFLGALLTAMSKPTGLFLIPALFACRGVRIRHIAVAVSAWALGLALVFFTYRVDVGTALAPFIRQGLSRGLPSGPWRAFVLFFGSEERYLFGWHGSWVDFLWALLLLVLLGKATWRKQFTPFTLVWSWILALLPLCSSLISYHRLTVVIYPVYREIEQWVRRRWAFLTLIAALGVLQFYWMVRYATFQWVG